VSFAHVVDPEYSLQFMQIAHPVGDVATAVGRIRQRRLHPLILLKKNDSDG
tara:strand:+ start:2026 stop:2178 length:153 start_codon:yes stop_codon:yes gene_type:complete